MIKTGISALSGTLPAVAVEDVLGNSVRVDGLEQRVFGRAQTALRKVSVHQ